MIVTHFVKFRTRIGRIVFTSDYAHFFVKLELYYERDEISDIWNIV